MCNLISAGECYLKGPCGCHISEKFLSGELWCCSGSPGSIWAPGTAGCAPTGGRPGGVRDSKSIMHFHHVVVFKACFGPASSAFGWVEMSVLPSYFTLHVFVFSVFLLAAACPCFMEAVFSHPGQA